MYINSHIFLYMGHVIDSFNQSLWSYMFPYIFLLLCFFGLKLMAAIDHRDLAKKRDFYFLFFCLLLILFSGLRSWIGWDYKAYYLTIMYGIDSNITGRGEFLTKKLVDFSSEYHLPVIYFLSNSIVCIFLISKTVRDYAVDKWMGIFIFLSFPLFFLNSLSVIRFFTALAITFFAMRFILSRNFVMYFLLIYVASLFHTSALLAAVLYFLARLKFGYATLGIIFALFFAFVSVFNHYVIQYFPQYAVYTEESVVREGTLAIYFFILVFLSSLFFLKKINSDLVLRLSFNSFFIGLVMYIAFFGQGTMSHRLSLYGTIYSLILVPSILDMTIELKLSYLYLIIYFLFAIMFFYIIVIGHETYIPYRTIFDV